MKKHIICLGLMLLALASCNKMPVTGTVSGEPATVVVNVHNGAMTKAEAYLDQQNYEKQINNVQVLIFDESGNLNAYKDAGTTSTDITLTSTTGLKKIWAVVNGPDLSGIAHLSDLKAVEVNLDANSVTASKGFLMVGSIDYTVSNASTTPASVTVSRLLSRIALRSVTHTSPTAFGEMVIERAFLQNVVSNYTLGNGSASELSWVNKMGKNSESVIIDGSTSVASYAELTYTDINSTLSVNETYTPAIPDLLYCYPNSTTTYTTSSSWSVRKTALTLAVKFPLVDDLTRYYTIILPDNQSGTLSPNTAYTVDVTISGLGSPDVEKPVEKSNYTASITVADWATGAVLNESL